MKFKRKFSLTTFLVTVSIVTIALGYISKRRDSGSDHLMILINRIGGHNYNPDTEIYAQTSSVNSSRLAKLFGDTHVVERAVHFGVGKIDARSGRALANSAAANGTVSKLTFYQTRIDEHCPYFIWDSVSHIEFEDVAVLPDSWIEAMANASSLRRVSFSGVDMDINDEDIKKFHNLDFMRLSNLGIHGERLSQIKKSLRNVEIRTSGLWGHQWPYGSEFTLSNHDPEAKETMQKLLDQLKSDLGKLDPPVTIRFNPPATVAEIGKLEQLIGQPLPRHFRAFLEIHNGQPAGSRVTFQGTRFMTIQNIARQYAFFGDTMMSTSFKFADWNPATLTFAEPRPMYSYTVQPTMQETQSVIGGLALAINLDNCNMSHTAHRIKIADLPDSLPDFLQKVLDNLSAGKVEQFGDGFVNLKYMPNDE